MELKNVPNSRGKWINLGQPSLGQPIKKIQKLFYSNQFFILLRFFYVIDKPRAANKKV